MSAIQPHAGAIQVRLVEIYQRDLTLPSSSVQDLKASIMADLERGLRSPGDPDVARMREQLRDVR